MLVGKAVKVEEGWCRTNGKALLLKALRVKLEQVQSFKDTLKKNKSLKFVEATLHPLYGMGHNMGEVRKKDEILQWKGENIMGELITSLTEEL